MPHGRTNLHKHLVQLDPRQSLPRTHPAPVAEDEIDALEQLSPLLLAAVEETLRAEDVGVFAEHGLVAQHLAHVDQDICPAGHELAADGVAPDRHPLGEPRDGGRHHAETLVEDSLDRRLSGNVPLASEDWWTHLQVWKLLGFLVCNRA